MVNVRISDRSFRRYRWVRNWMADVLACVNLFAAQSPRDAERLQALGANPTLIHVTGNMKFDFAPPATAREIADSIRSDFGRDRPVVIAGSTREHEEERVLAAFEKVRVDIDDALLVLVPRHPERFDLVAATAQSLGYNVMRRSQAHHNIDKSIDVYIGDTMGELGVLYGAADVAFVGGSLVPTGGHNLLEACAMGRPVLFGPHTFNFREISDIVISEGAGLRVASVSDLADTLVALLNDADRRFAMGEAGLLLLENNRGALQRTLALFANELTKH
jgi:3-deoxy-D-manno-octulosonic-acid transferase